MTIHELNEILQRRYLYTRQQPYTNPIYQPPNTLQLYNLKDLAQDLSKELIKLHQIDGDPRFQRNGSGIKSVSLQYVLPGGLKAWRLSGYFVENGTFNLQYLPRNSPQLQKLANEQIAAQNEHLHLSDIYKEYASCVQVTKGISFWLERGDYAGEFVARTRRVLEVITIESGLIVQKYSYAFRQATAAVTEYANPV